MWLNKSIVTINATLQLFDIYKSTNPHKDNKK